MIGKKRKDKEAYQGHGEQVACFGIAVPQICPAIIYKIEEAVP